MIGSLALLLAAAQPDAPPPDPSTLVRERRAFYIPDEIAPAVIPYVRCVTDAFRAEGDRVDMTTGETARAAQARALASCASVRAEAKTAAQAMLARTDIAPAAREPFVKQALAAVDHIHDHIAETLDGNRQPETALRPASPFA